MIECAGVTNRRKAGSVKGRPCRQRAIFWVWGQWWCWYHNPDAPKKLGEGYGSAEA